MKTGLIAAMLCALAIAPLNAQAHSVLLSSQPVTNATVSAKGFDIELKFDSRVDSARSRLTMELADGKKIMLKAAQGNGKGSIVAHADNLTSGMARLVYEVLSVDGHIARGVLPLTITAE